VAEDEVEFQKIKKEEILKEEKTHLLLPFINQKLSESVHFHENFKRGVGIIYIAIEKICSKKKLGRSFGIFFSSSSS